MWNHVKETIKQASGLNDNALHAVIGAAIFLALVLLTRRPWLSLGIVAAIQILNEAVDLLENITGSGMTGAVKDTVLTLIVPAVLAIVLARRMSQKQG
ncbi:hypothetical protein [Caulobacter sp. HMWF025]|uniref:hypothetical protein n=1 Tax=Caulobacter sp. HMWF025 TaxID=2056860 RepID=UPI000D3BA99A|nr:hypothetical protein [Caulobacter sp. HMWF025]PTT07334.1 hypothetical protein DBR10_10520 [Caulobacter sp. HMWF025]